MKVLRWKPDEWKSHPAFLKPLEQFRVPSGMQHNEYAQLQQFIARIIPVTEEEWTFHRNMLSRRKLFKGEFLTKSGDITRGVSFVNRGSLRAYWLTDGCDTTKNFFFENEYACDYESFLTQKPSRLTIKAMEDCELLELNYNNVQQLYERYPVWQKYGRLIAEALFTHVSKRSHDLLLKSPEELYLDLMQSRPHIIERVPLLHIASYLGIQPESLSRIRKRVMEVKRIA